MQLTNVLFLIIAYSLLWSHFFDKLNIFKSLIMCMLQNVYTFAYFKQDFYEKSDSETFIDLDLL